LTPESVQITPLPPWIHRDIRAEVFGSASLDGPLSIMDDDLARRVADAFSLHPWIAKVERVAKQYPARVIVDLTYRRPACMVEVRNGLLPVDASGVLLPVEDFSPVEAAGYPRLAGIDTVPLGTTGESWGDIRVVEAARLAEILQDFWKKWKLAKIVASPTGIGNEHIYALITRGGTQIHWGLPPTSDAPGKLSPQEKLTRLQKYIQRYGTLEGADGPQVLDVNELR